MTLPLRKREETGNTKLFLKFRDTHLLDFYLFLEQRTVPCSTATLLNPYYGRQEKIDGIDAVVVVGVKIPQRNPFEKLKGNIPEVYIIGDAVAPRDIASALEDAVGLCLKL